MMPAITIFIIIVLGLFGLSRFYLAPTTPAQEPVEVQTETTTTTTITSTTTAPAVVKPATTTAPKPTTTTKPQTTTTQTTQTTTTTTPPPATTQTQTQTTQTTTTTTPPPATPAPVSAVIQNFAFSPATITVKKGTTITWTNNDGVGHTVTGEGGIGPASATLNQGQSYSYTFNTVGTFGYRCLPHPSMRGQVTVTE